MILQKEIALPWMGKGFHLIDDLIVKSIGPLPETGLINLFLKHTSAALMLNENADPDVRTDLSTLYEKMAPEGALFYTHTIEGPDDMSAHFKTAVTGVSLTLPVTNHKINSGTWQGIYYCEFRAQSSQRKLVVTIYS